MKLYKNIPAFIVVLFCTNQLFSCKSKYAVSIDENSTTSDATAQPKNEDTPDVSGKPTIDSIEPGTVITLANGNKIQAVGEETQPNMVNGTSIKSVYLTDLNNTIIPPVNSEEVIAYDFTFKNYSIWNIRWESILSTDSLKDSTVAELRLNITDNPASFPALTEAPYKILKESTEIINESAWTFEQNSTKFQNKNGMYFNYILSPIDSSGKVSALKPSKKISVHVINSCPFGFLPVPDKNLCFMEAPAKPFVKDFSPLESYTGQELKATDYYPFVIPTIAPIKITNWINIKQADADIACSNLNQLYATQNKFKVLTAAEGDIISKMPEYKEKGVEKISSELTSNIGFRCIYLVN